MSQLIVYRVIYGIEFYETTYKKKVKVEHIKYDFDRYHSTRDSAIKWMVKYIESDIGKISSSDFEMKLIYASVTTQEVTTLGARNVNNPDQDIYFKFDIKNLKSLFELSFPYECGANKSIQKLIKLIDDVKVKKLKLTIFPKLPTVELSDDEAVSNV